MRNIWFIHPDKPTKMLIKRVADLLPEHLAVSWSIFFPHKWNSRDWFCPIFWSVGQLRHSFLRLFSSRWSNSVLIVLCCQWFSCLQLQLLIKWRPFFSSCSVLIMLKKQWLETHQIAESFESRWKPAWCMHSLNCKAFFPIQILGIK